MEWTLTDFTENIIISENCRFFKENGVQALKTNNVLEHETQNCILNFRINTLQQSLLVYYDILGTSFVRLLAKNLNQMIGFFYQFQYPQLVCMCV